VAYAPRQAQFEDVVLDTEITDDLRLEGLARELSRAVNNARKQAGLQLDDRITLLLGLDPGGEVAPAVAAHGHHLARETLATTLVVNPAEPEWGGAAVVEARVSGEALRIGLRR
jgi:isoleucyl-tRNA synthetase